MFVPEDWEGGWEGVGAATARVVGDSAATAAAVEGERVRGASDWVGAACKAQNVGESGSSPISRPTQLTQLD